VTVLDEALVPSAAALAGAAALLARRPAVGTVFIATDAGARVLPGDRWLRLAAARGPDVVGSRCAVLRRTTFEAAGLRGLGSRSEELALWLRMAALADVAVLADPAPPAAGQALPVAVGQLVELHERANAFRDLFIGFAPALARPRLRHAVCRALERSARRRALVAAYRRDPVEASMCLHLALDVSRWRRLP
jgi:hypothetical protein